MAISVDGFSYTGTNGFGLTANVPVGTTQSDLLLAWWVIRITNRPSANMLVPAGWTEIGYQVASGSSPSTKVLAKVWNTGDATTYTFYQTGSANHGVSMLRISGINTGTFATGGRIQFGAHRDSTRTSGTVNSIVVSTPNSMLFHGGGLNLNGASFLPPADMTEDLDAFSISLTSLTSQSMNHQVISASGSTGDKTTTYSNAAQFVGFLWWVEPAPSASDVTVNLNTLGLTGSAISFTVSPGAVTVPLSSLGLTGSAISLSVIPGAISVGLSTLGLTGSAIGLSVVPGAMSVPLSTLGLTGSAIGLSVIPGATSVNLSTLGLTGSAISLSVSLANNITISLSTLSLTGSAISLNVVPGTVTIPLSSLGLTGSAVSLSTIPGAVSLLLDTLGLVSSVINLSVFLPSTTISTKRIYHVAQENRTLAVEPDNRNLVVAQENRTVVIVEVE